MSEEKTQHTTPRFIDYKDTQYLKKFVNAHARIQPKKRTHVSAREQREVAQAIKRSRYMALMPYIQQ